MSKTLKQTRESMETHTVFVVYKNGKPLMNNGRIAYEREQDAKSVITSMVNYRAKSVSKSYDKKDPDFIAAEKEIRAEYKIVPYRAYCESSSSFSIPIDNIKRINKLVEGGNK